MKEQNLSLIIYLFNSISIQTRNVCSIAVFKHASLASQALVNAEGLTEQKIIQFVVNLNGVCSNKHTSAGQSPPRSQIIRKTLNGPKVLGWSGAYICLSCIEMCWAVQICRKALKHNLRRIERQWS